MAAVVDTKRRNRRGDVHGSLSDRLGLRDSDEQGSGAAHSRHGYHRHQTRRGRPGSRSSVAKDSLWSLDLFRCESAVLRTHWVLVVMDQWTVASGFGVHRRRGWRRTVPDVQSRDSDHTPPTYLSADHDPLYRFHQWQANLRIRREGSQDHAACAAVASIRRAADWHHSARRLIARSFGRPQIWR